VHSKALSSRAVGGSSASAGRQAAKWSQLPGTAALHSHSPTPPHLPPTRAPPAISYAASCPLTCPPSRRCCDGPPARHAAPRIPRADCKGGQGGSQEGHGEGHGRCHEPRRCAAHSRCRCSTAVPSQHSTACGAAETAQLTIWAVSSACHLSMPSGRAPGAGLACSCLLALCLLSSRLMLLRTARSPSTSPRRLAACAAPCLPSTPSPTPAFALRLPSALAGEHGRKLQQSKGKSTKVPVYKANDPMAAQLKNMNDVNAFSAWDLAKQYNASAVVACIVDTGGWPGNTAGEGNKGAECKAGTGVGGARSWRVGGQGAGHV